MYKGQKQKRENLVNQGLMCEMPWANELDAPSDSRANELDPLG